MAPISDMRSEWVGDSLIRATVREYQGTFVIQVMELTEKRTSKKRAADFARTVARGQREMPSVDFIIGTDVEVDRKAERLDGTKVLTHIRTTSYIFG